MPVCTTCTAYLPHLYTEYESAYNLRLEQCSTCHCFADPYVEHDSLTLLLDLILLKRGVYRHLLYNRGTKPRKPKGRAQDASEGDNGDREREKRRWMLSLKLGGFLIFLDSFIRWSHLHSDYVESSSSLVQESMIDFSRVFLGCCAETLAFHFGIIVACYVVLRLISWTQTWLYRGHPPLSSDIKREFRFSLIPLTLFYSSLTKFFLLFLLTVWRPTLPSTTMSHLKEGWIEEWLHNNSFVDSFKIFEDDQINREWIIRNVLGGMSAGFGLRVVLDIQPVFTSIIILAGWRAKTFVTALLSSWVGGASETASEAWRAYSIP